MIAVFFLRSFTLSELCSVILHSLFTGKFLSYLKRGTMTTGSIILHCLFCLNVTQSLLCCCVHSHTTHRLAALQIVNASSYPISTVGETHFEGFYYSPVGIFSPQAGRLLALSFTICHDPSAHIDKIYPATHLSIIFQALNFKRWLVKSGIDCDSASRGVHQ